MDISLGGPDVPHDSGGRLAFAQAAARTAVALSRALRGGSGGVIGGRVLLRLAPGSVAHYAASRKVTLVTGTNGKSTTTAMLTAAHRSAHPTETNADGANTPAGIATTLARVAQTRPPASYVVLETDEGWLPWAVTQTRPGTVVLLNLSRDQLHRNPEVLGVAGAWRRALDGVAVVVANADDPAVVWAAGTARRQVWVAAGQEWVQDSLSCPACGHLLDRDASTWSCRCGFRRPEPTWEVRKGQVLHDGVPVPLVPVLPGAVNLSNAAMALAAADADGVPVGPAAAALESVRDVAGRFAHFSYGEHDVRLVLAKNPAGWQAAMEITEGSGAPLVVGFNSDGVDGRDPSWLYDVDFRPWHDRLVTVYGRRASDMSVRLRQDDIVPLGQFGDLAGALRALPPGPVDLVANYTAFQEARGVLDRG